MNWYEGQQVYCLRNGEGKIITIDESRFYPITAVFQGGCTDTYNIDGYRLRNDATPMLYHAKPEIIAPKWQPEPGQWCWFWDSIEFEPCLSRFLEMNGRMNGRKYRDTERRNWSYCEPFIGELPSYLKEVEK
jgi:hypothetical protein